MYNIMYKNYLCVSCICTYTIFIYFCIAYMYFVFIYETYTILFFCIDHIFNTKSRDLFYSFFFIYLSFEIGYTQFFIAFIYSIYVPKSSRYYYSICVLIDKIDLFGLYVKLRKKFSKFFRDLS